MLSHSISLILTCSFALWYIPQLQATVLGNITRQTNQQLAQSFFKSVSIHGMMRCLTTDTNSEIIFGNEFYGFQAISALALGDFRNDTIEILPPGYGKDIDFYCQSGTNRHKLGSRRFSPPQSALLSSLSIRRSGHGFTSPFLGIVASQAIPHESFAASDKKNNMAIVLLINRFGEIIWAHVPTFDGQYIKSPIRLESADSRGLTILTRSRYQTINLKGQLLDQGRTCFANQCPKDEPNLTTTYHSKIYQVSKATGYARTEWQDFLTGPLPFSYPQLTRLNIKKNRLEPLNHLDFDQNLYGQNLVSLSIDHTSQIAATEGIVLNLKTKSRLQRPKILALAKIATDRYVLLTQPNPTSPKVALEQLKWLDDGTEQSLATVVLPNKKTWYKATVEAISPSSVLIFALRSSPDRSHKKTIEDDLIFEWNFEDNVVLASLVIQNQFYSQTRNTIPLIGLPGYNYLGGRLASF